MIHATRTQHDGAQNAYSANGGLDCSDSKDATRQEFKDDVDVNKLLAKFGVGVPRRQGVFGTETDYNIDLQQALDSIRAAKQAWRGMPKDVKNRYKSWQALLGAVDRGDLTINLEEPPEPPKTVPPEEKPKA